MEYAFYKCVASRSLEGGIYKKGPFRRFGRDPPTCSTTQWERIERDEFKRLATEWHGKQWEAEILFWSEP